MASADVSVDQYGLNARPDFKDTIQIMDLPAKYIPETGKHRSSGRLVIVGDVHGMKESLVQLLEKVGYKEKLDHLILAGDIISKGPDSAGVVDLARELDATVPADKVEDALEEVSFSHGDYKDRKLVKDLGQKRIKWLKQCPVILRVGKLGDMGEVVVVHAGLVPGVELEKQDPTMVMNMRTIEHGVPSDEREGHGWMKVWNEFQKHHLSKHKRSTVIYGHDSKRGLQMEKYSMGIDTGCLKGGKLSAIVIEGGQSDHKHKLVQVDCKDGRQK
ncbi:putative metallophosphoesterase [Lachnellula arida]|uniref:Putative metallophosphoesterase n=1 Tax=Lachnellula arida TaxID=1316785 RepID=A0A8T9B365_9HELO|nr:putative metallophosphoesterase [Lachnellula arida]